ncbi:MAG: hypothetical protein WBO22_16500 [Shewanella indica]|uniref:hypothetical protein n=1 Tax=Shewanella indica TaxID=768528 RepID=UPI002044574D|nr:hypothetical protein [Shewanella indica]
MFKISSFLFKLQKTVCIPLVIIGLSGCSVLAPLSPELESKLTEYPSCQNQIDDVSELDKVITNLNALAEECIRKEQYEKERLERLAEREAALKDAPLCESYFYGGAGASHKAGMACVERSRKRQEQDRIRAEERRKYLASPEGKAEQARKKQENNRIMLICDNVGREIETKYNVGRYDGTTSRRQIGVDMYYCVALYKKETSTGYMMQSFKGITINTRTGSYNIQNLR